MTKYHGKIYEGRWMLETRDKNNTFTFRNIYNNEEMKLSCNSFYAVEKGETTISKIRCNRVKKTKKGFAF